MSFAIVRGGNGRRHEVDFGDDPVTLDVSTSEAMVQITIEAAGDPGPSGTRRFVTLAVPREELITALNAALGSQPLGRGNSAATAPGAHRSTRRRISSTHR